MLNVYAEDRSRAALAFLADVQEVCRRHGLAISHEDAHGSFLVEPLTETHLQWVGDAAEVRPCG